jgi:hypothetical protein
MPEFGDLTIKLPLKLHNHMSVVEQILKADPLDIKQRVTE